MNGDEAKNCKKKKHHLMTMTAKIRRQMSKYFLTLLRGEDDRPPVFACLSLAAFVRPPMIGCHCLLTLALSSVRGLKWGIKIPLVKFGYNVMKVVSEGNEKYHVLVKR